MSVIRSVFLCFSMFSVLPVPRTEWKEENMGCLLAALPLVGAVIGLGLWLWSLLCRALSFGPVLYAAGMTLLPLLLSGGVHMDGFCDTADALASRAPMEKKRAILKDPHAGAFAVIAAGAWLLAAFALHTELSPGLPGGPAVFLVPVASRCLAAWAGLLFPGSGQGGLLQSFRSAARKKALVMAAVLSALCLVLALRLHAGTALAMLGAALVCLGQTYGMSRRQFGGMSGDLAGWLLQLSELAMWAALILVQKVVLL